MTWQNNLVRLVMAVAVFGSVMMAVLVLSILLGSDGGKPGGVATFVLLLCLVGVMAMVTGFAIERESVKSRLPRVRRGHLIVIFIVSAICLGVKSFMFGLGVGLCMVLGIFLFKGFDARLRAAAVCGGIVCLVFAEALRRSGGYDSGGVARYLMNFYSFSAVFFPGLLMISTLKVLPRCTTLGCFGFAFLTLHSGLMLCSGMSTVLANSFEGRGQGQDHEYCIKSSISSPMGIIVSEFQNMMFPDFMGFQTTTRAPPERQNTVTTTTLFDCSLLSNYDYDDNFTNATNRTDGSTLDAGVDTSHCVQVMAYAPFDANSTSTSTTAGTTTTSTTSTSTTSTTSTTTTSTSTTSTTTTTTTTSTTSTSTRTTSTSSTDNETMTTAPFVNTSMAPKAYVMTGYGEYCPYGHDITDEAECRIAASVVGKMYGKSWNGAGDHKYCLYADDGRVQVFFNSANTFSPRPIRNYASLCYRASRLGALGRCVRGSEETQISPAGSWALAVFFLAAGWTIALTFVFVLFAPSVRVHPEHVDPNEDAFGIEAFRAQQELNSKAKRCKKTCKKICHVIFKSTEMLIIAAVFAVSGIALVVVGGVQLPLDKPECAAEPRSVVAFSAWITEVNERVAIVWCDLGAMASVGLATFAFCCFLLGFSMSFFKARKYRREENKRRFKMKLRKQREKTLETGEAIEEGVDYGEGFRVQKMIPKDPLPEVLWSDYDGRIFEC